MITTVQIQNGKISTHTIPKLQGYTEFLTNLENLTPYIVAGQISMESNIGVMAEIMFVNGERLSVVTQVNKGKIRYSLNGKVVDREGAIKLLGKYKAKMENMFKAKGRNAMHAKTLYQKLANCCCANKYNGLLVFDNVRTGGSDDSWSSRGTRLNAFLEGDRIKFVLEKVDCGETHISWNNNTTQVKYYPNELTVNDLVNLCNKNGKVLN